MSKTQRLGREKSIDIIDEIKTNYGTINRLAPNVIFINGKFWIQPDSIIEYDEILSSIISTMRGKIKFAIRQTSQWCTSMIFDMDIKTISMSPTKKNYGDFELYLKQNQTPYKDIKDVKQDIISLLQPILTDFKNELIDYGFVLTKTKK